MKILTNKSFKALQEQAKGYSDGQDNSQNLLFRALQQYMQGRQMAPMLPLSRNEIKKAYETNGPLFGIVNLIAKNTGEVAKYLELYKRSDESEVTKHWLLDVINHPNDRYTRAKHVEGWAVNRLLYGDAWQYAPMSVGAVREGKEIYLIPSHIVAMEKNELKPFDKVSFWGIGSNVEISMDDVVESFDYNLDPASPFGTSKAVAAGQYLKIITTGMLRQETSLKNGGVSNIITPKGTEIGIKPSDAEELEKNANKVENANKSITFKTALEVHQIGSSPADMAIADVHKEAVTALCFAYGIPVDLYYGQSKYENAKEAKKTIYEQNAIPMAEEWANDLLRHYKLDGEFFFKVNTDNIDVLQDKPGDVLDNLGKMHSSLNELREAYGYDRIEEEWADRPIMPLGVQFGNEMSSYDIDEE